MNVALDLLVADSGLPAAEEFRRLDLLEEAVKLRPAGVEQELELANVRRRKRVVGEAVFRAGELARALGGEFPVAAASAFQAGGSAPVALTASRVAPPLLEDSPAATGLGLNDPNSAAA